MSTGNYPVKKTGSADNERLQINKALESIFQVLSRADQWDQAVSWGDHSQEGYASALSELSAFADLGVPANLTLSTTLEKLPSGNETHSIEASWTKAGDSSIVYDLEIRECDPSTVVDDTSPSDIIANTTLYSIPIVSNDVQESIIKYRSFFEPDVRYFFRVRIRQNILVSNWSAFENITTSPSADIPPAPTSLTATSYIDAVKLTWDYAYVSNPDVAKIEILRDSVVIDDVPRPAKQYIDASLDEGVTYAYQVRAVTFNGTNSVLSSTVSNQPVQSTVTIRSATLPNFRPDGSALKQGDIWIETDEGDRPYTWNGTSWIAQYTEIPGDNINDNSITAAKISVTNLEAISTNTGTLTSNLIRTAASGQRLELTDPGTDATYSIWIGDGTKNDANSVFYVKHDGSAFINKTEFDIQTGEVNVGSFSNANSSTGGSGGNTLVASSGATPITVGAGGIKFEVNFFFVAATSDNNVADNACPVGTDISGELELLRNTSNTISGATSVQTITFRSADIRDWVEDSDPSLAPGVCNIRNDTDLIKIFVDTGVTGDYHYFVRFSQWDANSYVNSPVNEVFTNTLYVTWTTGN